METFPFNTDCNRWNAYFVDQSQNKEQQIDLLVYPTSDASAHFALSFVL
jgi:hypothetical protein